ncbi:YhcN/YlaJ family sporulation lipoprotein [Aquibacillus albus]|uniref:Sporulation protein n=1 Tax=Aquibacillus albus TaxID=1168171 RepID=A0ABS2MUY1_9BACI|nr:YhcN/YlaJ family sporulation lipoprotein [Aquibacillus albus]MBM7569535.1 hypothetical protein [Aquibacillus albus]
MKKITVYPTLIFLTVMLSGCLGQEGSHNGEIGDMDNPDNNNPIAYSTEQEEAQRRGLNPVENEIDSENPEQLLEGYQTKMRNPNDGNNASYNQSFYNQESQSIAREINQVEGVKISQVIVTDNHVIVSVMLDQYDYKTNPERIAEAIYNRTTDLVPDKEVNVYTDAVYWNKMKNLNARLKDEEDPERTQTFIEDFLE